MTDVPSTMRAWRLHEYGSPMDVLRLEEAPVPTPNPGEVLVKVQGIPFNLNDLERVNGGNMAVRPEFPYAPGMEVMGEVVRAGAGAEAMIGRRVASNTTAAYGGYAEYATGSAASAFDIPESIPLPGAAAIYFPFHLAWVGLIDRADLQAGESVLIHAAAGGSGSAAIQVAKHRGARVFATAGGDGKLALCRELGADVAIDYTSQDFAEVVLAETGGRGVDVVFDNVGEAVLEGSLKSIAYNGRFVSMGFASNKVVADEPFYVPRRLMLSNIRFCGVMLGYAAPELQTMLKSAMGWNLISAELGRSIHRQIIELVQSGELRPVVGRTVGFDEIPDALQDLADRGTTGRVVALV